MAELTEPTPAIPPESVFHPDNVGPVTLLTLLHIKDYLNVLAGKVDADACQLVESLHENGEFLCPPPVAKIGGTTKVGNADSE